jgi:hypothetical protein
MELFRNVGRLSCALLAVGALSLAGCGGTGGAATAKVTGKVTHNGEPVKGGTLTFGPINPTEEGVASGVANVQQDGTFTVSTYGEGDGAVLGKHRVSYMAPPPDAAAAGGEGGHAQAAASPYENLVPSPEEIEVKSGANEITIELVPSGGAGGGGDASATPPPQ